MQETERESLRHYSGEDRVISSHEMKLQLDSKPEAAFRVKSLIPSLDHNIEDFRDGELITISGPTKNGKTLLAQTLTVNFEKQGQPSLWFTYEVPARQFLSQYPVLPTIYMPAKLKVHALDWLEDRIIESFEKYHTRIVFIDHLHYLVDMARMKSPSLEIGTVVRRLKGIAVNNELVVFLLCHTTKGKQDGTLSYESIRDSSFVSQESDSVLMIKRTQEDGENTARLRIEFHRRTGVLEKVVGLTKTDGLLRERISLERMAARERVDLQ
jgi:archaellum biogenesis ATPase FlaH